MSSAARFACPLPHPASGGACLPNDASVLRLVTMLLAEQNDEWTVGRRYFSEGSMTEMLSGSAPPTALELR